MEYNCDTHRGILCEEFGVQSVAYFWEGYVDHNHNDIYLDIHLYILSYLRRFGNIYESLCWHPELHQDIPQP